MVIMRYDTTIISKAIIPLLALAVLVGCPAALKTAQIQVRIKSDLYDLPASQVIPRVDSELDSSAIYLEKHTNSGDSVYWWGNQSIEDFIGEPIIIAIYLAASDSVGIFVDTVLVQDNRKITYVAYFGVAPEYGSDQNVYRKFPLSNYPGDTLYIDRDIADDRPVL
jgi:hypothetical protein